ncbi:ROK family protein [Methylonatrum kenyense]|uniref:ROK family protein n=1 Tax=Methylonatrum kenyense TaxID=455253 RepID=UPI0020BEB9E3|nr:ROK family protein [Methylonatrum kenyense]MCK8516567.1 ROK family protein [Methylonatrum kenyense]
MRIGIDLGGTKIAAIAMGDAGDELERLREATPQNDYAGILACIRGLITRLEQSHGPAARIGIGTPGSASPATGLIRNANSVVLNGQALQQDLEKALGRPLRLANDANCFALSEARDGAAAGADCVFGVIVGTGTGAGIVVRGALQQGVNRIGGEWGHNPLPWPRDEEWPGPACYCGRRGCIETWLSGPGLSAAHHRQTGIALSAAEIAAAAAGGDAAACRSLEDYADRMARGLATVINVLDPDVIVLGGGLGQIRALYQLVPDRWGQYVFSDVVRTRLLPPRHGDDSGLRGAALL